MGQAATARHFYDRIAGVYDAMADRSEHDARELGLRLLAPTGSERVLEIGFGTGHGLVAVAGRLGPEGRVCGVDVSPGMLAQARRRVEASAVADRVGELEVADAKALPYGDGTFDAVFMSFTLELFDDDEIPVVLGEIARVLRPGGRLGVVAMNDEGRHTPMVDLYRFLHRHFPHIVDCRPIDAAARLGRAGYEVAASENLSIWGLPVLAVVARRREGP